MIPFCQLWNTDSTQWHTSDWTWGECEMVQEICQVWSTTKFPWFVANWKWSECSSSAPSGPCAVWGTTAVPWNQANWKWSECTGSVIPPIPVVVIGNRPGVDAETLIQPWQLVEEPWNPYISSSIDKKKRLIKLICKVKGQTYSEEKEAGDYKVTVGDIRMVVKAVANIDLDLKLEE
jgi:hypothetical protein